MDIVSMSNEWHFYFEHFSFSFHRFLRRTVKGGFPLIRLARFPVLQPQGGRGFEIGFSNLNAFTNWTKKKNICFSARFCPRQLLFPTPNVNKLSFGTYLLSSLLQNLSGLNIIGSVQCLSSWFILMMLLKTIVFFGMVYPKVTKQFMVLIVFVFIQLGKWYPQKSLETKPCLYCSRADQQRNSPSIAIVLGVLGRHCTISIAIAIVPGSFLSIVPKIGNSHSFPIAIAHIPLLY